jgi:hypothetical protein
LLKAQSTLDRAKFLTLDQPGGPAGLSQRGIALPDQLSGLAWALDGGRISSPEHLLRMAISFVTENADCALLKSVTAAFHMLQVGIGPSMSSACKPWGSSASSYAGHTNRNRL